MHEVRLEILSFVDEHFPGFVECRLVDATGASHYFIEKAPVVSAVDLRADSSYPQLGAIACEIENECDDGSGTKLVTIRTDKPWSIESTNGSASFTVLSSEVKRL